MNGQDDVASRIARKLMIAKSIDSDRAVFGADAHGYRMGRPAARADIASLEDRLGITLPQAYRTFVSQVGNGSGKREGSAAGPFYGIYPLGEMMDALACDPATALANPCIMSPDMTAQEWLALVDALGLDGDLADEAYDAATCRLFGGVLPLGTQGCSYLHCLVLNGPHAGRVVNVDMDFGFPQFAHEPDFLAWYERWLDEVISGDLLQSSIWFGYEKGGPEACLLAAFATSADARERAINLSGLLYKRRLQRATLTQLATEPGGSEHAFLLCQIVCKSDYQLAKPLLAKLAQHDAGGFLKCLHWYARDSTDEWEATILAVADRIAEIDAFRFFTYALERLKVDRSAVLLEFTASGCEQIRAQAFYALGKAARRERYLAYFIRGLGDADHAVVRNTLQALQGVRDPSLTPHYRQLLRRFPVEQDYILTNLDRRLQDMGVSKQSLM